MIVGLVANAARLRKRPEVDQELPQLQRVLAACGPALNATCGAFD
jgi:hypothetical protein